MPVLLPFQSWEPDPLKSIGYFEERRLSYPPVIIATRSGSSTFMNPKSLRAVVVLKIETSSSSNLRPLDSNSPLQIQVEEFPSTRVRFCEIVRCEPCTSLTNQLKETCADTFPPFFTVAWNILSSSCFMTSGWGNFLLAWYMYASGRMSPPISED